MSIGQRVEVENPRWPLLGSFPGTSGLVVLAIFLWLLTGLTALGLAVLAEQRTVPDAWYSALEVFTATAVVQFLGKRGTHTDLWRKAPTAASTTTTSTTTTKGPEPPTP